jgi:hypothetical protein
MHRFALIAAVVFCVVAHTTATRGLDLSIYQGNVTTSSWKCLREKGYEFAIIEAWVRMNHGSLNPYAVGDIKNAWTAGFKHVDSMTSLFVEN